MKPFVFYNPTRVVYGEGVLAQVGEQVKAAGMRRVLWVYGQASIRQTGVYDAAAESLRAAGVAWIDFPGVRPNPVLSHARQGVATARREQVDGVLAVGGGSAIDEAKAIAAGAAADRDVWDFYDGSASPDRALPLVAVQTLPATGTEMNGGTVLTHDETREKLAFIHPAVNPRAALLDPAVTATIAPRYWAYSAVDAMSHLMESYLTHGEPWAPIQDRYVEGMLKALMESVERILRDPSDLDARGTFMWATTLAWNGLASAGVGPWGTPNHMLEHPLSGLFDVAHGAGLAVVIPAWMTWRRRRSPERIDRFSRAILGVDELRQWFKGIGAPVTFRELGVPADALDRIVEHALILCRRWEMPEYTEEQLREIYQLCL